MNKVRKYQIVYFDLCNQLTVDTVKNDTTNCRIQAKLN